MSEYLTPDDVADLTGLSAGTIRAAVRAGELRATRPRRRILIHRDAVADWLEACTIRPGGSIAPRGGTVRPSLAPAKAAADVDDREWARELRRSRRTAA